jgi:plastocyanin
MRRALLTIVLLPALVAAGCSGSSDSSPVATTEVQMAKSYRFEPRLIRVSAGDTVTWTNDDNFTHTVQVDGQADHEVGRGKSVSLTFERPGRYHYVCTLHRRDMDGEVVVE